MNRHELRRQQKKNSKTPTYNVTKEQLESMIQHELNAAMERKKSDIIDEVTNQSVALMILLPMKVLIEDYWPKTYKQKLPDFIDKTMQYYSDWQNNKLDIEELKEFLWNEVGIKLESCKVED